MRGHAPVLRQRVHLLANMSGASCSGELAYLTALLHYSSDALLSFDMVNYRLLVCNQAATRLLRWDALPEAETPASLHDAVAAVLARSGSLTTSLLLESVLDGEEFSRAADYDASTRKQLLLSAKLYKDDVVQVILVKITQHGAQGGSLARHSSTVQKCGFVLVL
jgi:hypothetical protein